MKTEPGIVDGIKASPGMLGSAGQVVAGALIAAALLALFASRGLQSWADEKGDGAVAIFVGDTVETWSNGMERLGLTAPHDRLRRDIRRVENAGWD